MNVSRLLRMLCALAPLLLFATGLPAVAPTTSAAARVSAPVSPQDPVPGSELTILHIVIGQGDYVWERFGHNALWIRDNSTRSDIAWNWGIFDFNQQDFIPRLARGQMLYMMAGYEAIPMIEAYTGDERSVMVQELNLTPAQKLRVRELAREHARPENRHYLYDYYLDNCSTRIRDLLDEALGGRIRAASDTVMTATTYRWHTQRLLRDNFAAYTGAMLALGHPSDRRLTAWEEMFLPVRMGDHLRAIRVPDESGAMVPLVSSEEVMYVAPRPPEPVQPDRPLFFFGIVGLLAGAIIAGFGYGATRSRGGRVGLAVAGGIWSLLTGLLGVALLLLWGATDHVFMYRNENVLQFSALSVLLVVLLPATFVGGRWAGATRLIAFAVAGMSVAGALLHLVPGLGQVNAEIILLALPAHVALAWGVHAGTSSRDLPAGTA